MAISNMRLGKWQEAGNILVELMNGQCVATDQIKNSIAWSDLFLGGPALLEEADVYSKEALGVSPKYVYFQGAREPSWCVSVDSMRVLPC
jgi:hypothetical protein